jgi:hypothetical protein
VHIHSTEKKEKEKEKEKEHRFVHHVEKKEGWRMQEIYFMPQWTVCGSA